MTSDTKIKYLNGTDMLTMLDILLDFSVIILDQLRSFFKLWPLTFYISQTIQGICLIPFNLWGNIVANLVINHQGRRPHFSFLVLGTTWEGRGKSRVPFTTPDTSNLRHVKLIIIIIHVFIDTEIFSNKVRVHLLIY